VSSVAEGETPVSRLVKFTVRGESIAENEILDITDSAERPVSVVKEGSGTWVLGGEQSFRGSLDVKGGKLIVRRPEAYTWHRWTITSKVGAGDGNSLYFELQEFGLFGEDGMRKNLDLAYIDDYAALRPGEVAFGTDKIPYTSSGSLAGLFDDQKTDPGWRGIMRPANATKGTERPEKEKPLSWMPIVMRLPNGAGEIKSYDIVHYQASTHVRSFASYFVDGSVDGIHWDRLSTVDPVGEVGANDWEFRGTDFGKGGERNKSHSDGCKIASAPAKPFDVLNNVKSVSVNSGAELVFDGDITIPALSFDCSAGGGTFTNCKFAEENGFVDIVDADDAGVEIDFGWTFNNCDGVANIAQWGVKVDGVESVRYSLAIKDGNRVVAVRPAMRIIIR
jgi:autotransporter-associated beta strand protein